MAAARARTHCTPRAIQTKTASPASTLSLGKTYLIASMLAMPARRQNLLSMQGTQGMLESPDAGDAGMLLVKLARMQRMLAGMLATAGGDLHCIYSTFRRLGYVASGASRQARDAGDVLPNGWAGLRAGDAGDAEEELGVQQNTSAVYKHVFVFCPGPKSGQAWSS